MNRYDIQYREQTASRDDICAHLIDCDAQYRPSLSSRVDIGEYATKLFKNAVTFEAWHQQALIGMVATYFNDATHTFGYITSVSVARGYQGTGVASYLLRMCIDKAKRLGVNELRLEVASINNSALSLYRKFDFVEFASSTHSISMQLTLAGNTTS